MLLTAASLVVTIAAAALVASAPDKPGMHQQALVPPMLDDSVPDHPDGAWMRPLTLDEELANTTHGSVIRSSARLSVSQPASAGDMCEFGRTLPRDLVTIVITSGKRRARAQNALSRMCLPNPVIVDGYAHVRNESEVSAADRAKFGPGTFESLSLGEIAIHLSHRRALDKCLQSPSGTSTAPMCLIMEDDFSLVGPRVATRWRTSYAALLAQPAWHFVFLGRCMDAHCGADHLRVSSTADLYRTPTRNVSMGTKGWEFATPMCLHAYLVTREGARSMLGALGACPGLCPADWAPAAMADRSPIFTIAPALFTQSTALRLAKDTGAVFTEADVSRGLKAIKGNTWRPAMVAECIQRPSDVTLPESYHAPWLRALGGAMAPRLNAAVQFAYQGWLEARAPHSSVHDSAMSLVEMKSVENAEEQSQYSDVRRLRDDTNLSACVDLRTKLLPGGSRHYFEDTAWQPGAEAVDAHMHGCALQYVSSLARSHETCDLEEREAVPFRCPFESQSQSAPENVSARLTKLHCLARIAGFVTNETDFVSRNSWLQRRASQPVSSDEIHFQETEGWPRPSVCGWRTGPRMDYKQRQDPHYRIALRKMVNHKRGLEFRPVLKVGSTVLRHLLTCLQPDEWSTVHQSVPMPVNYTALVVVREPFRRFTSALIEIMRRLFTGVCPDGPCEGPRDHYFTNGADDTADDLARHTSWYRHALRLYKGEVGAADRPVVIRDLLAAVVTDTSCLLDYYASEHLMTQMQLAAQGTPLDTAQAPERAIFLRLEDIGHTTEAISGSPLLDAIGEGHESKQRLQTCLHYAHALAHNTPAEGVKGALADIAAPTAPLATRQPDASLAAAARLEHAADTPTAGFMALPTEDELYDTLNREHALLLSLCHVYAQDMLCLASQFEPPPLCRALLST